MQSIVRSVQELFIRNNKFSALSLGALMLLAIVGMGLYSLTSLSGKAMKGYMVDKLETERQELVKDGEITDMLILRARSFETIEGSDVVRGMRKADRNEIVYVTPVQVVAQR